MKYLFSIFLAFITALTLYAQPQEEINLANEYFNDGEYGKALELYEKVLKTYPDADFYVSRIVDCYTHLNQFTEAGEFIGQQQKRKTANKAYLSALEGKVFERQGNTDRAETVWADVIDNKLKDINDFYRIGGFFMTEQKYKWALKTYQKGRDKLNTPQVFANELAYLYQMDGNLERAIQEYINIYTQSTGQYDYVKSQILRLVKDDKSPEIEKVLLTESQKRNNDPNMVELLYSFYMEANNYEEAFLQVRALDKMKNEGGNRIYKFSQTLQNNKEYDLSNKALDYLINNYKDSPFFLEATMEKAKNFELKALESVKTDTVALRQAVSNYNTLFTQYSRVPQFFDAMYRKARICIFYLSDLNCALDELNAIEQLAVPLIKKAEAKLLLGDVFIMQGEYNKAKLKYAEVEKAFENTQMGAMAKFRAARLSYYKGDFEDSKAFLKILKENTSNDIANDAIRLYLTIQDNTGLDSTTTALEKFAHVELLIYQKKYDQALPMLDSIAYHFPNHPLADDIFWQKSQIFLQQGKTQECLSLLDKILEKHKEDIFADDALFTKAEIYESLLGDKKKAQELYFQILTEFPASLYKVEARKRVRKLRTEKATQ